jgi:hypothetical protein
MSPTIQLVTRTFRFGSARVTLEPTKMFMKPSHETFSQKITESPEDDGANENRVANEKWGLVENKDAGAGSKTTANKASYNHIAVGIFLIASRFAHAFFARREFAARVAILQFVRPLRRSLPRRDVGKPARLNACLFRSNGFVSPIGPRRTSLVFPRCTIVAVSAIAAAVMIGRVECSEEWSRF